MSFENWPIGRKLAAVMACILALFLSSSALAIYQSMEQDRMLKHMITKVLEIERALKDWGTHVTAGVQRASAIAKTADPALTQYFAQASKEATAEAGRLIRFIREQLEDPEDIALMKATNKVALEYLDVRKAITDLQAAGDMEGAERVLNERFEPLIKTYLSSVNELANRQRKHFDSLALQSRDARIQSMWVLGGFTAAAIALGILLAWVMSRSITRPLHQATKAARAIAELNLSDAPQHRYARNETGDLLQAIDQMRTALNQTLSHVLQSAQSISTTSEEVANGSTDLSARTENTAANLEQSARAVDALNHSAEHCANATSQAEQLSRSSCNVTNQGYAMAQNMQRTMEEIQRSSQKIGDIIAVIDGIAFQTNILALNAAVEAARAGEQGRGFAVVAGEVRTLAQRSATAAKEIRALIDSNLHSVSAGHAQVQQTCASMQTILDNVTRVQDIVGEVTAATQEQSRGATQINQGISQLDQMTQQNAALVEEFSAAAAQLNAQAQALREAAERFQLSRSASWSAGGLPTLPGLPALAPLPQRGEPGLLS